MLSIDFCILPPQKSPTECTVLRRYDYDNATAICLWLQGGECIGYRTNNFNSCAVRCWGTSYAPPVRDQFGWSYPKSQGLPQGRTDTLAGTPGQYGYVDGPGATAQFKEPSGVAVAKDRTVYVTDTGNHVIRAVRGLKSFIYCMH